MHHHFFAWQRYFNHRMLICVLFGFSSGLPLFVLLNLLQAWLAKTGVHDVKVIGMFTLVMFPYTWKFVWSPLMDRFHFGKMGRRRGWLLVTQLGLLLVIGSLGMFSPATHTSIIFFIATLLAFLSASQDIVIDAYRREILLEAELGLGNAIHMNIYKLSNTVPGALSLILADRIPWQMVFWITALFMLPGLICTMMVKEPKLAAGSLPINMRAAIILPFQEFITRSGWKSALWMLMFIFLFKLGDATALATKFYIDLGFSLTQIGTISQTIGLWTSIAGGLVGGIAMVKLGINRALWVFGILQAVATLSFIWLAYKASMMMLGVVIGLETVSINMGTAALVAYIMRITDPRYTATQLALFSSIAAIPRTLMSASGGYIVAHVGWISFFLLCFMLALPGIGLLFKIAPWNKNKT